MNKDCRYAVKKVKDGEKVLQETEHMWLVEYIEEK
jgi:hypothetical protein